MRVAGSHMTIHRPTQQSIQLIEFVLATGEKRWNLTVPGLERIGHDRILFIRHANDPSVFPAKIPAADSNTRPERGYAVKSSIPIRRRAISLVPEFPNIEGRRFGLELIPQPTQLG